MLTTKLFLYEYLLLVFFGSQLILNHFVSPTIIIILFVLIYGLKFKYEGFKITFPLFALAQFGLLYFSHILIHVAIIAGLYLFLDKLPVYHCPEPSGPFKIGFKEFKINNHIDISLFYPTLETTKDLLVHEGNLITKRNYEGARLFFNIYIPYIVPQIIHEIAFSFFWKLYLGVNNNARIIEPPNKKGFPVIVFSHGIACSKNLYTIFTKEWASRGYIVFCIDHDEEIYCNWKYPEDLIEAKRPLLTVRKSLVQKTLDFIEDKEEFSKLLETDIQLDKEKVFMVGHSFGGGTSATVVSEDKRITGGVILLDPFVGPCPDKVFEEKIDLPILCIRTEEYDKIMPIRERVLDLVRNNSENVISGYFKDSFHCSHCDLILYLPKELSLWEMNGGLHNIEPHILYHRKMMNIFFDGVERGKEENPKKDSKQVVKEIRRELDTYFSALKKENYMFYNDN